MTREQLLGVGFTRREIETRLERRRFRRLRRGVYLLGPTVPPLAPAMAAVLACGPGAVISHRSAVALWELLPYPAPPPIEVTVPGRDPGTKPGIAIHRVRELRPGERTTYLGIPVTTAARTLLDLAPVSDSRALEQAVAEAFARNLTARSRLISLIDRHPRHRGSARLHAQLEAGRTPARTRSRPEERMLRLIREAGLPEPEVNVKLGRWEVDFLWRENRLVVEVDAYGTHSSPWAFERDRLKSAELQDAGYDVRRVSRRQLLDRPQLLVGMVARAL